VRVRRWTGDNFLWFAWLQVPSANSSRPNVEIVSSWSRSAQRVRTESTWTKHSVHALASKLRKGAFFLDFGRIVLQISSHSDRSGCAF